MMKILLVYPSHLDIDAPHLPKPSRVNPGIYPPLGLLYIASSLKKKGFHEVRVLDGQTLKDEDKDLREIIQTYRPTHVGFSTFTLTLFKAVRMAKAIKDIDPSIHITFGGPHLRVYPMETASLSCVDSVVLDEGENSYPEMLKVLESGRLPYGVRGIIFKDKGNVVVNEKRGLTRDLDSFPFPYRGLLDKNQYYLMTNKAGLSTTIISSRGCPYKCIFCCTPDKTYRQRSPGNITDEIEECMDMGIQTFNFMDDVFNLTKKRVVEFSREILRRQLKIEWTFTGRVDVVDKEMLEIARESGLTRIAFGIESGSDESLGFLQKGFTLAESRAAVRLCKEIGLEVYGHFLLGIPYETEEEVEKTIRLAFDLGLDVAQFYPLTPRPGTKLYTMAMENGGFERDYFLEYAMNPDGPPEFKYWETSLTQDKIQKIIRAAYRRFFLRPSFFLRIVKGWNTPRILLRQIRAGFSVAKFALGR